MAEKRIELDPVDHRLPVFSIVCNLCKHADKRGSGEGPRTCKAFPGGIPDEIWTGKHNHQSPFAGDGGIRFQYLGE